MLIAEWTERSHGGTVAIPAGVGRQRGRWRIHLERLIGIRDGPIPHPDHLFLREVALTALERYPTTAILLYEELPYGSSRDADAEVRARLEAIGRPVIPCTVPVSREQKARRIGAYASQIPHLLVQGERLDHPASVPSIERYWYLPPLREAA